MKNFKKVISAVIALAMVISSFTAVVNASKFTDVADTANYAEAVEVLSTLGIVNGTEENGTWVFKPENPVTRAEAATLIVGALNMSDDAKASAGTSQFADVNEQAAWAQGYVNVGVAQGFINGYDAATFGPLDNVTYAQMCVMLTSVAGYGEYAAANGGWPTGYTNMAAATGMNKGVAVAQDANLTKGQVAMMIYNTLVTPKLGVAEYALTGNTYSQLDGKNDRDYQTLLSEKFEGYVANVLITETPVSGDLENDEVSFDVVKADWWPEDHEAAVKSIDDDVSATTLFADGVDVNGNYLQTGKAVFTTNEDDELVMVYFKSNGKTETKELAADTYNLQSKLSTTRQYAKDNQKIRFGSTDYRLAEKVDIYVNGKEYTTVGVADVKEAKDTFDKLIGGATGNVKLVKADEDSKNWSAIFVDYYQIAEVVAVDADDDTTTVSLGVTQALIEDNKDFAEIEIDTEVVEDGETVVKVTRNGAEAKLTDLKRGDIIAYAVDFKAAKDLVNPKVIEIIATNEVATGTVTKTNVKENEYTIGGKVYGLVDAVDVDDESPFTLKETLELTLDPFGRIFDSKQDGSSKKYAIVLRVDSNYEDITLLLSDGTQKTFEPANSTVEGKFETLADKLDGEEDVTKRIVTYTVKGSTGELSGIALVNGEKLDDEYKSRTNKLGISTITSTTPVIDATKVVSAQDAKKATSYAVSGKDSFVDGTNYVGVVYKEGTYVSFVVLTEVGTKFTEATRFAVVQADAEESYTTDDELYESVLALYDGKAEQELKFESGVYAESDLAVGDAFFFETNVEGFIDTVYKVYDAKTSKFNDLEDEWDGLVASDNKGWSWNLWDEAKSIQLAHGIIVDVDSTSMTFAKYVDGIDELDTNKDLDDEPHDEGIITFGLDANATAYVFDVDGEEYDPADNYRAKTAAAVKASNFDRFETEKGSGIYKDTASHSMADYANEAIVMIVDGDVVAIYALEK